MSGSTAIRPDRSVSLPVASASSRASGRRLDPRRPDRGARCNPVLAGRPLEIDTQGVDADDPCVHHEFDAHLGQRLGRAETTVGPRSRQRLRPTVDQHDAHRSGVDAPEVRGQASRGELPHLSGELHAGGSRPHDHHGEPELPMSVVGRALGELEGAVDRAADLEGVVDCLHSRGDERELVVTKVGLPRSGRHDETVVGVLARLGRDRHGLDDAPLEIEAGDLSHLDLHVVVLAEDLSQHWRDLTRREESPSPPDTGAGWNR